MLVSKSTCMKWPSKFCNKFMYFKHLFACNEFFGYSIVVQYNNNNNNTYLYECSMEMSVEKSENHCDCHKLFIFINMLVMNKFSQIQPTTITITLFPNDMCCLLNICMYMHKNMGTHSNISEFWFSQRNICIEIELYF